jgi:hypothetical protein
MTSKKKKRQKQSPIPNPPENPLDPVLVKLLFANTVAFILLGAVVSFLLGKGFTTLVVAPLWTVSLAEANGSTASPDRKMDCDSLARTHAGAFNFLDFNCCRKYRSGLKLDCFTATGRTCRPHVNPNLFPGR